MSESVAKKNGNSEEPKTYGKNREAVVASLAKDYEYVCYLNTKSDELVRIRTSNTFMDVLSEVPENLSGFKRLSFFLRKIVIPEDLDDFITKMSKSTIQKKLADKSTYDVYFRSNIKGEICNYIGKMVRDDDDSDGLIFSIRNFDDEIRNEIRKQEQDVALRAMEKQLELSLNERTLEIREKNETLNRINDDIIELLGDITEARDLESGEHIKRVKGITYILATQVMNDWPEYGLDAEKVSLIASASALHDIGKIMIPDAILLKPGKLTNEEFAVMKTHSEKGCEILGHAPKDWDDEYLKYSMEICHYHHEKVDGRGYPCGLRNDEIPISAQIVSVADCFDALTTKRVYKDAYDPEVAFNMILSGECGAFSDKLMTSFKKCKQDMISSIGKIRGMFICNKAKDVSSPKNLFNTKLLYVDDDVFDRDMGVEILEDEGAVITIAESGEHAIEIFKNSPPGSFDAILMDVIMKDLDGAETAKAIRELNIPQAETIPIIALTASTDEEDVRRCLDAGMNSYLVKPISVKNITKALLEGLKRQSETLQEKLNLAVKDSRKDSLTGVKNITAYTEKVEELSNAIHNEEDIQFAMIECDINDLTKVNDTFGHHAGDLCIQNCSTIICSIFKHSPVYRIGGDELMTILEGEDYDNREELIEKLKDAVDDALRAPDFEHGKVSFAFGNAEYDDIEDSSISTVIKRTQTAMLNNKKYMKFRGMN